MTHPEMDELYELYLLNALEPEQAAEISEHISRNCEFCQGRINAASEIVGSLASLAESTTPAPHLRERILSIARPVTRQHASRWQMAFALAAAACLAFLVWGINQRNVLRDTAAQLNDVREQRNELRSALEILVQSDTRAVKFGESQSATHGQVFLSRNGGVVFLGSNLPQLAAGKTFQLWLVPPKGNPKSAGLFTPNLQGISVDVLAKALNPTEFAAVAVSIEPAGGSPQPSSKPILIVPLA